MNNLRNKIRTGIKKVSNLNENFSSEEKLCSY